MADSHPVLNRIWLALGLVFALVGGCRAERVPPADARLVWWHSREGRLVTAALGDGAPTPLVLPVDEDAEEVPSSGADRACQKCHAIGAGLIAFTYFGIDGPGGLAGLSDGAARLLNDPQDRWNFSALHASGERLVANTGLRLAVRDTGSGAVLTEDAAGREAAQPAFAARGDALVFLGDLDNDDAPPNEMEFQRSSLYRARLDGDVLADVERVVDGGGQALAYPAVSPDGRFAAYTRAPWSQTSRGDALTPGSLELVDLQTGDVRRLLAADPAGRAWMPSFYAADDGLWLVFVDRRDGRLLLQVTPLSPDQPGDPSGPPVPVPAAVDAPGFFPRFVPR